MPSALGYDCSTAPVFHKLVCIAQQTEAANQPHTQTGTTCDASCMDWLHWYDNTTDWSHSLYYHTFQLTVMHIPPSYLDKHSTKDACMYKSVNDYASCERHMYNITAYYNIGEQSSSPMGTYDLRKCAGLTGEEAQKCFNYQNYNQMWNQGSAQERELASEREACAGNPNACAEYQSNMRSYANNSSQNSISESHDSQMVCVDKSPDGTCIGWVNSQDYAKATQFQPLSYKQISQNNFLDYVKSFFDHIIAIIYNHSSK